MKNRIWVVVLSVITLASCQSSRFMQDDMYFTDVDAKREVREYEIDKSNPIIPEDVVKTNAEDPHSNKNYSSDNYYDYSYSSRIRRFNTPNNTWSYYDPYYTNYYWYNPSTAKNFGNSVYSTYTWWGPNFGNNYSYDNWGVDYFSTHSNSLTWKGSWTNNKSLYFNSFDNNCYVSSPRKKLLFAPTGNNFSLLMLNNGISRDVITRPNINYTAIRESNNAISSVGSERNMLLPIKTDSIVAAIVGVGDTTVTVTIQRMNANKVVVNNNSNKTSNSNLGVGSTTNNNTTKRWDNYNADVNISPNNNVNSNWSRSGVFSEGSRNNNYEYKGSTMPNKNGTNSNKTENKTEKKPK